ncbi:MAG: isocitrate lyase/phosphoenolpyruvate mutase family protein [Candidatus Eremiobacteraeota bacterium]|nr:isocitrate lyase/phosphoenolpyruvate mutase family protein [Candidatus Eremiobacteraeota bacterium]
MNQQEKAARLRELHHAGDPLVFVNAWDCVTARILETMNASAIATSSAAIANVHGFRDGQGMSRAAMLDAVCAIVAAVCVPVSADLEGGYGESVDDAIATANGAIDAGAVGLNFEDASDDGLLSTDLQSRRIRAIRQVGTQRGVDLVINARTDVYLKSIGAPEGRFAATLERAKAYVEAGADCIFVPGVSDSGTIAKLVQAIAAPLNILAGANTPSVSELGRLGVRRISCGGAPHGHVMAAFQKVVADVAELGTFDFASDRISHADLNALF